jgi:DNA processing protein
MKYEFWLASLTGINSKKRIHAQQLAGDAKSLFFMREQTISNMHIFSEKDLNMLVARRRIFDVDQKWSEFLQTQIQFVPYSSDAYPTRLKEIYQPPYALYVKGNLPKETKSVAIVGARMCSEYGRSMARMLSNTLAAHQVSIISGLALGIDSAAHAGTLAGNGKTYAVLGCGCDICYPANARNIYNNILDSGGGILSEYPPKTTPKPYFFPERNRIISALSDVVVIIEAKEKSGSLITADFALEQGKDIYAIPGRFDDTLSKGCNELIAQGAGILYDIEKFLENIGIQNKKSIKNQKKEQILLEKDEILVYSCLDLHPKFINNIIEETGLNLLNVLHALDSLKANKLVQETFQNYYSRCI